MKIDPGSEGDGMAMDAGILLSTAPEDGRESRKQLGRYYTPSGAAHILCAWAIRTGRDRVLEPSFGACGFLEAAAVGLREAGASAPVDQLYGCDVDASAFSEYLRRSLGRGAEAGRFLHCDFLTVRPHDFDGGAVDAVVGNPPYVSYHTMNVEQRAAAERALAWAGLGISAKASLWAYFLLHSTAFLRSGGRMAWILPSSFLYAEYAADVREHLRDRFERCLVVQLGQRLFLSEGTEEATVVVLAEDHRPEGGAGGALALDFAETLADLGRSVSAWKAGTGQAKPFEGRASALLLSDAQDEVFGEMDERFRVVRLGDLADVRIGIVTGANPFFIVDQETADRWELPPSAIRPILAKFAMAPGLALRHRDLDAARRAGRRLLLVDTNHPDLGRADSSLCRYLDSFPEATRATNKTFGKRALWHRPDDAREPDAFFPYMYQHGPRIILNEARTTSTNTIHRVYFREGAGVDAAVSELPFHTPLARVGSGTWRRTCAVSILSTYSQLSGELQGRSYGAGVLKHEPSEARCVRLVLPDNPSALDADGVFERVDEALRAGDGEAARALADAFTLGTLSDDERAGVHAALEAALCAARRRRRPIRPAPQGQ